MISNNKKPKAGKDDRAALSDKELAKKYDTGQKIDFAKVVKAVAKYHK